MAIRVLIVDAREQRSRRLERALTAAGFEVVAVLDGEHELHDLAQSLQPDAIVVDAELPGRDTLEHLASLGRRHPKPIIMLSDAVGSELTLQAARAGVSAYAVDSLSAGTLRSLLEVAIAHFHSQSRLRKELAKTQASLASRKLVDRAKCRLMEEHGIGEERAYQLLRKLAMDRRLQLEELASELLEAESTERGSN